MIAMIAGSEEMRRGPIPLALAHAGFEPRQTFTTDEVDATLGRYGPKGCVLVLEAGSLDRRAGSATWSGYLMSHRALPAVVVTRGEPIPGMQAMAGEAHRILVECPFDAAAVVVAARQASSSRRLGARVARPPFQEAG
jgi:hypothetical protein